MFTFSLNRHRNVPDRKGDEILFKNHHGMRCVLCLSSMLYTAIHVCLPTNDVHFHSTIFSIGVHSGMEELWVDSLRYVIFSLKWSLYFFLIGYAGFGRGSPGHYSNTWKDIYAVRHCYFVFEVQASLYCAV